MFDAQKSKIEYSHPNFDGGKSAVALTFNGVFPEIQEFDHTGHHAASVQEQPGDAGGWVTRKHTSGQNSALLVNGDGYEVTMGDGSPVVKLNGVQVFPL